MKEQFEARFRANESRPATWREGESWLGRSGTRLYSFHVNSFLVASLDEGPEVVRVQVVPPTSGVPPTYRVGQERSQALIVIGDDDPLAPEARLDFVSPGERAQITPGASVTLSVVSVWTEGEVQGAVEFYDGSTLIGRRGLGTRLNPRRRLAPSGSAEASSVPSLKALVLFQTRGKRRFTPSAPGRTRAAWCSG